MQQYFGQTASDGDLSVLHPKTEDCSNPITRWWRHECVFWRKKRFHFGSFTLLIKTRDVGDVVCFTSWALFAPSLILVQINLVSLWEKCSFKCFLVKSNLASLMMSVTSGLHLGVNLQSSVLDLVKCYEAVFLNHRNHFFYSVTSLVFDLKSPVLVYWDKNGKNDSAVQQIMDLKFVSYLL